MADDIIPIKTYSWMVGKCGHCRHGFFEEVDYSYFARVDMEELRIPEGEEPPVGLCMFTGSPRQCRYSDDCPDYEGADQ